MAHILSWENGTLSQKFAIFKEMTTVACVLTLFCPRIDRQPEDNPCEATGDISWRRCNLNTWDETEAFLAPISLAQAIRDVS